MKSILLLSFGDSDEINLKSVVLTIKPTRNLSYYVVNASNVTLSAKGIIPASLRYIKESRTLRDYRVVVEGGVGGLISRTLVGFTIVNPNPRAPGR